MGKGFPCMLACYAFSELIGDKRKHSKIVTGFYNLSAEREADIFSTCWVLTCRNYSRPYLILLSLSQKLLDGVSVLFYQWNSDACVHL